jgi:hypothetical protein
MFDTDVSAVHLGEVVRRMIRPHSIMFNYSYHILHIVACTVRIPDHSWLILTVSCVRCVVVVHKLVRQMQETHLQRSSEIMSNILI